MVGLHDNLINNIGEHKGSMLLKLFTTQAWLERTPGLGDDFNFPVRYKATIDKIMAESLEKIEAEENETMKAHLMASYKNKKQQFESIFDQSVHDALVKRGERRFSHKALLGALMICMYSEEPRCALLGPQRATAIPNSKSI